MNQGPRYGYYLGYEQSLQPPSVLSPEEKVRYESKTMAHASEGTSKVGTNSTSWTEPVKMSRSECGSQTLNCELSNQMLVEFKQSLCTNFPLMVCSTSICLPSCYKPICIVITKPLPFICSSCGYWIAATTANTSNGQTMGYHLLFLIQINVCATCCLSRGAILPTNRSTFTRR